MTQQVRIEGNATVNGIRLGVVGAFVAGDPDAELAEHEKAIAKRVARRVDKMKRQGYQPALAARMIDRWVQSEALALGESPGRRRAVPVEPAPKASEMLVDSAGGED